LRCGDRSRARRPTGWLVVARIVAIGIVPVLAATSGSAFIPEADRTIEEIARVNRSSGRSQAVQLDLTMSIGDRGMVARGQLISHPSGLARLELRGLRGRVDRYLLSGDELLAAKDGLPLTRPQPMLQPWFFLQPSSGITLRAALDAFDVMSDQIGLATCGDQDCFVIGDPRLAAPLPDPEEAALVGEEGGEVIEDPLALPGEGLAGEAPSALKESDATVDSAGSEGSPLQGPAMVLSQDAWLPRLWVDTQELQVRRIDRADGVFTIFGPVVSFEKLRVPAWLEIHEPGGEPIRFDVDRAVAVNAPPTAFSRDWVFAPVEPSAGAEGSTEGETPGAPGRRGPAPSSR
jgi:hypothetical protein